LKKSQFFWIDSEQCEKSKNLNSIQIIEAWILEKNDHKLFNNYQLQNILNLA
jgi:hypothetical protein